MLSFGASEEEVTIAFGNKSVTMMKSRLALLELDGKVIDVLEGKVAGKRFSFSAAAKLASEPRENQAALMNKLIDEGRATVEETVREVTVAKETRASAAAIPADTRRSKPGDKPAPAPTSDHAAKPKMVIVNRLLTLQEKGTIDLDQMTFTDCLKWMNGLKSSSKITGLNACLKLAEKPVKKDKK